MTRTVWKKIRIADLVASGEAEVKTGPFGTQLHASDYVESGTPVINVRNIGFGGIRPDKLEYIADETVNRLSGHILRPGDIVFGRKGAVERHVLIRDGQNKWFQGSDCLRLRLRSKRLLPQFVSYYLLTEEHKQWMQQQCSHGATMASMNQEIVGRIEFLAPDPAEQRRIASILSAYDDLIENNTRRIAILEEMSRRIYEEWFVRFRFPGHEGVRMVDSVLGLVPEGWRVVEVQKVIRRLPAGTVYKQADVDEIGSIPVIDQSSAELLGFHCNEPAHHATPESPVVIFGDHTCKMQLMVAPFSLGPNTVPFVTERLSVHYVFALVRGLVSTHEYKRHWSDLMKKKVLVSSDELAARYGLLVQPMAELVESLRRSTRNLRTTRDLLLPKLISGEIDVSTLAEPEAVTA